MLENILKMVFKVFKLNTLNILQWQLFSLVAYFFISFIYDRKVFYNYIEEKIAKSCLIKTQNVWSNLMKLNTPFNIWIHNENFFVIYINRRQHLIYF